MVTDRPSQWPTLFDLTIDILNHFEETQGFAPEWSFGGGTALMLAIDHRESHDIDIFLDDPQLLPYLNPQTQGYAIARLPNSYASDGSRALKLAYEEVGEIDFICSAAIVADPYEKSEVRGQSVLLERPAEIIAKKVYFRGGSFQPRDMFDLAAVVENLGEDYAVAGLRECGANACATALETVNKAKPEFVQSIIGQLMFRESTSHLVDQAQDISRLTLEKALAGLAPA